jgi:hypothetical protein
LTNAIDNCARRRKGAEAADKWRCARRPRCWCLIGPMVPHLASVAHARRGGCWCKARRFDPGAGARPTVTIAADQPQAARTMELARDAAQTRPNGPPWRSPTQAPEGKARAGDRGPHRIVNIVA